MLACSLQVFAAALSKVWAAQGTVCPSAIWRQHVAQTVPAEQHLGGKLMMKSWSSCACFPMCSGPMPVLHYAKGLARRYCRAIRYIYACMYSLLCWYLLSMCQHKGHSRLRICSAMHACHPCYPG
jgi:hypothetical protein